MSDETAKATGLYNSTWHHWMPDNETIERLRARFSDGKAPDFSPMGAAICAQSIPPETTSVPLDRTVAGYPDGAVLSAQIASLRVENERLRDEAAKLRKEIDQRRVELGEFTGWLDSANAENERLRAWLKYTETNYAPWAVERALNGEPAPSGNAPAATRARGLPLEISDKMRRAVFGTSGWVAGCGNGGLGAAAGGPDDAPLLTREWFNGAEIRHGETLLRPVTDEADRLWQATVAAAEGG